VLPFEDFQNSGQVAANPFFCRLTIINSGRAGWFIGEEAIKKYRREDVSRSSKMNQSRVLPGKAISIYAFHQVPILQSGRNDTMEIVREQITLSFYVTLQQIQGGQAQPNRVS